MIEQSYWNVGFFQFFPLFFKHLFFLLTGQISLMQLASDDIQVLTLTLLGVSASIVGSFLLVRRMAMVANSLSHTVLVGIVTALGIMRYFFKESYAAFGIDMKILLLASVLSSLLTGYLTNFLHKVLRLEKGASTGLVFTTLFALGILLVTLFTRNTHIGMEAIMGNIDVLHVDDLKISFYLLLLNLGITLFLFKEYVLTAFDSHFAQLSGFSNSLFTNLLLFQTSITVIGAFRAVGVVLVLALLVLPTLTARFFTTKLYKMIIIASCTSFLAALLGVGLTRHILTTYGVALSTAGMVVTVHLALWIGGLFLSPSRGLITHYLVRRRLKKGLALSIEQAKEKLSF